MLAQEALQKALFAQYNQMKAKNPAFSLRAYARRLNVNSGVLSSILKGSRRVSSKMARKLMERMALTPEEMEKIESLYSVESKKNSENQTKVARRQLLLKSDQFHLISDGIHYAILSLMETHDFISDPPWMAERLQESVPKVKHALERLERLGLIKYEKSQYQLLGFQLSTSDGVSSAAIRRFHDERLQEAREKLHSVQVGDRDFFATTLAVKKSQLPVARKMVREFKKKLEQVLEKDPKNEVYRFCFQLYPVTRVRKIEEEN